MHPFQRLCAVSAKLSVFIINKCLMFPDFVELRRLDNCNSFIKLNMFTQPVII